MWMYPIFFSMNLLFLSYKTNIYLLVKYSSPTTKFDFNSCYFTDVCCFFALKLQYSFLRVNFRHSKHPNVYTQTPCFVSIAPYLPTGTTDRDGEQSGNHVKNTLWYITFFWLPCLAYWVHHLLQRLSHHFSETVPHSSKIWHVVLLAIQT